MGLSKNNAVEKSSSYTFDAFNKVDFGAAHAEEATKSSITEGAKEYAKQETDTKAHDFALAFVTQKFAGMVPHNTDSMDEKEKATADKALESLKGQFVQTMNRNGDNSWSNSIKKTVGCVGQFFLYLFGQTAWQQTVKGMAAAEEKHAEVKQDEAGNEVAFDRKEARARAENKLTNLLYAHQEIVKARYDAAKTAEPTTGSEEDKTDGSEAV